MFKLSSVVALRENGIWLLVVAIFLMRPNGSSALRLYKDSDQSSGDYSDEFNGNAFNRPSSSVPIKATLQTDINEFIELVPANEVRAKIMDYYKNDGDVQHVFNYVNGKEFWSTKKTIFDVREVKELEMYFSNMGVNIKEILYKFDDLLGISKLKQPPQLNTHHRGHTGTSGAMFTQTTIGGLYGMLEDILALLPQDEIFILFFEKLDSSIEFSNMVESIGSQEFGMKFDSLKKSNELKKLLMELHKHKIDVKKIIELFQSFFLFGTF